MRSGLSIVSLTVVLFVCSSLILSQCNRSERRAANQQHSSTLREQPELAEYMSRLQYYTHKLALAVGAENQDAAAFYFHELEELVDDLREDVPEYEGYDIAGLMKSMLQPQMDALDESLAGNDRGQIRTRLITLVDACNDCHAATQHGFIVISPGFDKNPYNQDFKSR